ncbi:endonuclease VII [Gordonia phage SpeedDemon]|nr:endonuclease VII [Gordonia phage SpeedDemon]
MSAPKSRSCNHCGGTWTRSSRSEPLRLCSPCRSSHHWCTGCQKAHPHSAFTRRAGHSSGLSKYCRDCERQQKLIARYGITAGEFDALVERQDSTCPVCTERQDPANFVVDHCHSTLKIRGLLCASCNVAIGHLKDNPANALRAGQYLEQSRAA